MHPKAHLFSAALRGMCCSIFDKGCILKKTNRDARFALIMFTDETPKVKCTGSGKMMVILQIITFP